MQRIKRALPLLLALLLLAACGSEPAPVAAGTEYEGGVNLRDVTLAATDEGFSLSLSFVGGSRVAGVAERALSDVPASAVSVTGAPTRLVVTLSGVEYADYQAPEGSPYVLGVFHTEKTADAPFTLYIHTLPIASYTTAVSGSTLTINAVPAPQSEDKFAVALNAFDDERERAAAAALGMTPSATDTASQRIMLSAPYDTAAAAESAIDGFSGIGKTPYVVSVSDAALPAYNAEKDLGDIEGKAVLERDGQPLTVPVAMSNARYICCAPDGTELYAEVIIPQSGQDTENVTTELLRLSGKTDEVLEGFRFYAVKHASFSPDGRYLAILENAENTMLLYVYDTATELLTNVGEEGFGSFTCSYTWDTTRSVIYAMTGDTVFQLMQFDPATGEVSSVEEQEGAISDIALAGDSLYFSDGAAINAVTLGSGVRREVCDGFSVTPCPDGQRLALLERTPTEQEGESPLSNVIVLDTATGAMQTAAENVSVERMSFAGSALFIVTLAPEPQGDYIYELLRFENGALTSEGFLSTAQLTAQTVTGELMLVEPTIMGAQEYAVTYRYKFNQG